MFFSWLLLVLSFCPPGVSGCIFFWTLPLRGLLWWRAGLYNLQWFPRVWVHVFVLCPPMWSEKHCLCMLWLKQLLHWWRRSSFNGSSTSSGLYRLLDANRFAAASFTLQQKMGPNNEIILALQYFSQKSNLQWWDICKSQEGKHFFSSVVARCKWPEHCWQALPTILYAKKRCVRFPFFVLNINLVVDWKCTGYWVVHTRKTTVQASLLTVGPSCSFWDVSAPTCTVSFRTPRGSFSKWMLRIFLTLSEQYGELLVFSSTQLHAPIVSEWENCSW